MHVFRLACNLGYQGLLLGVESLVGNIYINSIIGGAAEQVAYSICFLILTGGRKKVYVMLTVIGGFSLMSSAIVSVYAPGEQPFTSYQAPF